jgi:hypothetical protein
MAGRLWCAEVQCYVNYTRNANCFYRDMLNELSSMPEPPPSKTSASNKRQRDVVQTCSISAEDVNVLATPKSSSHTRHSLKLFGASQEAASQSDDIQQHLQFSWEPHRFEGLPGYNSVDPARFTDIQALDNQQTPNVLPRHLHEALALVYPANKALVDVHLAHSMGRDIQLNQTIDESASPIWADAPSSFE